jgi:hypothetical protein
MVLVFTLHLLLLSTLVPSNARARAQADSRWLPTAAARVRAQVWSYGICGGQSDTRTGYLRVLWFPLLILIPPTAPQSPSFIVWVRYNRPVVAAVPSGISLTLLRITVSARAQAVSRRLLTVAAVSRGWVMWDLWWSKWHWCRFSPSISPTNSHSTDCSILTICHAGLVQ